MNFAPKDFIQTCIARYFGKSLRRPRVSDASGSKMLASQVHEKAIAYSNPLIWHEIYKFHEFVSTSVCYYL